MHAISRSRSFSAIAPLVTALLVVLGLAFVGPITAANADPGNGNGNGNGNCVPVEAVAASFSDWTTSSDFTDWQRGDTGADPDGESGDQNPLNLQQLGAVQTRSVDDGNGYTLYYTGAGDGSQTEAAAAWVETSPGDDWTQFDQRTVTDHGAYDEQRLVKAAYDETEAGSWWNWSPNDTNGPQDYEPNFPTDARGTWQGPHTEGGPERTEEGTFNVSRGASGNSSWFHRGAPTITHHEAEYTTVHHDAVTHQEYRYSKQVPAGTHTEYRWAIQTRTYTAGTPAVTCTEPKGSNGHVKVDDDNLDGDTNNGHGNGGSDNGGGNDPHLNCTFNIEWYGYDATKTITSEVHFIAQDPTASTTITVSSGNTNPTLVNGALVETYTLSFTGAGDPQQNHGYHVMITIDTEGTIGADQKHKVFWVEPCPAQISATPSVAMHDECGTANDTGPDYAVDNQYWTAAPGAGNTVVFTAKAGYVFPAGPKVTNNGTTWTESYTPNTDVACSDTSIPLTPSVAMHDECGTANDSGPTYATVNDYWTAAAGAGNTIVFTAKTGYVFPAGPKVTNNGTTWTESYTPNTDVACSDTSIPLTPSVAMHDECGTANDSGPTYATANDYWTAAAGAGNTIVFTAKSGYAFPAGPKVTNNGTTWTESYTPNTDVPCTPPPCTGDQCSNPRPNADEVTQDVDGCDLSAYHLQPGAGERTGFREYVLVNGVWVPEPVEDITWGSWQQTSTYDDAEYFANCAGDQPEPQLREVPQQRDGCQVGGVETWTDVYTTDWVWNTDQREWVLGQETGPVQTNREFTKYTRKQLLDMGCIEVEGEQAHQPHQNHHGAHAVHHPVAVQPEQAATGVPTVVHAGLTAATPAVPEPGHSQLPLWLIAAGASLLFMGAGGRRRRRA